MNESNEPCGDMELRICDPRSIRRLAPRSAIQCVVLAGLIPLAGPLPAQQAPVVGTVAVKAQDIAQSGQFTGRVQAVDRVVLEVLQDELALAPGEAAVRGAARCKARRGRGSGA